MIEEKIKENVNLSPLSSFKIGGTARFFVEVKNKEDLREAIKWAKERKELAYILGGGSNILINDSGVEGLVLKIENEEFGIKGDRIEAGAGVLLAKAMVSANGRELSGFEWAVGIPGTVGGAVRGNAGNIGEIIETVEVYDSKKDRFENFSRKDCEFAYRESVFKEKKNLIVWKTVFKLGKANAKEIKKTVEKFLSARKGQPNLPSAGSVFKNVPLKTVRTNNNELAELALTENKVVDEKIPAGWLIDYLGLKGKIMGGVKISLEHANFIVNTGNGKTEDVIMLISYIKQQVRDKLGIQLTEEIQYFGI